MMIVVTGGEGFIGRNLRVRLRRLGNLDVVSVPRGTSPESLKSALALADWVFHLAGVNRPPDEREFVSGNVTFTESLCAALVSAGRRTPVVYASSRQATLDNPYGRSKLAAERVLLRYSHDTGAPVHLFRLTNVFGKWCRPFYNSAVATFCHQISRGLPITISDPTALLRLIYVDDVVDAFVELARAPATPGGYLEAGPTYEITLGALAKTL